MDFWLAEESFVEQSTELFCGVDEAGRGPLAGPVCAAAVILPRGLILPGLRDSKKMSPRQRDDMYGLIVSAALAYAVAFSTVSEIEEINIQNAAFLAMNRAIEQLYPKPELCLVDGNRFIGIGIPSQCIVGGDGICPSIAAASVIAKVTRDRYMVKLSEKYPQYGFEQHKGYPTAMHYERLREHGASPVHRMSFLKKFYAGENAGENNEQS